jgi:LemA protein
MLEMLEVSIATFSLMVLAALAWLYGAARELSELRRACDEAWANVERLLRRRDETLGPFLALCEGSLGDGAERLRALAASRARLASAPTTEERAQASSELSAALGRVLEAALKRPTLPEGFPELKARLEELEEQLADWIGSYDTAAQRWNARLVKLPESLVARLEKARPRDRWTARAT